MEFDKRKGYNITPKTKIEDAIKVIFQPDSTEGVDNAQITALKTDASKKRSGKK